MIDPSLVENLLARFRVNPSGIRDIPQMASICLGCGSTNVKSVSESQYYYRYCRDCKLQFYRNACWNCKRGIDARDPNNTICLDCSWLKCTCGACYPHGCESNPYSMNNRLIDNPDFLLPKKDQPDECPECGGDGYDTEDGGQCSSCRGTGDSSDCDYDYDYDYDCSEDEDDDLEDEVSNDNSISDKNGQSYIESSHRY